MVDMDVFLEKHKDQRLIIPYMAQANPVDKKSYNDMANLTAHKIPKLKPNTTQARTRL